jgi:hypothetical protein
MLLAYRKAPEAVLLGSLIAIFPLGYATCPQWHGNLCWGPRYIVPAIPFAVLPLGELIVRKGISRLFVLLLEIAGVFVQLGATLVDFQRAAIGVSAFFTDPGYSQIVAHWRDLLAGKFLDWMPLRLYAAHGLGAGIGSAVLPVAMLGWATANLAKMRRRDSCLKIARCLDERDAHYAEGDAR